MAEAQKRTKLAYLVSHPIQYQAPLLRYLSANTDLDLEVFFMSDHSLGQYHDKEFNAKVAWDIPLVDGYKHTFLKGFGPKNSIDNPWPLCEPLGPILRQKKFDVLWTHGYHHQNCLRALLSAKSAGLTTMVRSDIFDVTARGRGWKRRLKDVAVQALFKRVDIFLAVGERNRAYYLRQGARPEQIFTLTYAVDNDWFQAKSTEAQANRDAFRTDLGFEMGQAVILFASKLTRGKRLMNLVSAYEKVCAGWRKGSPPGLLIIGDGVVRQDLEAWIAAANPKFVKFLGFKNQSELPAFFAASDLFVLPAEVEAWGLIVNEVMNASLPVIVSNEVGCGPDLVRPGWNGGIFPVGDVDALANLLSEFCGDTQRLKEMGQNSLDLITGCGFDQNVRQLQAALGSRGHHLEVKGQERLAS